MRRRNLRFPVYAPVVTKLANWLKLRRLGVVRRLRGRRDRRRWPLRTMGYEKCRRNLLSDKQKFGILFDRLPRFTGD